MKRVLGMGNALVDILVHLNEDSELGVLEKGTMTLVSRERMHDVMKDTAAADAQRTAGGSAANTINGLATLGIPTGFIGKIGDDKIGASFREDMLQRNVRAHLMKGTEETGCCVVLISPDHERTMATYLGAAIELDASDIESEMFVDCAVFHVEGYLVQNHPLLEKSLRMAREAGCLVSLDLASHNTVGDNLEFLRRMVDEYVDIAFANEEEARVFTGESDPVKAAEKLGKACATAVVKVGPAGSLIREGERMVSVEAVDAEVVDTTGAGDMYAAGFLYGRLKGLDLETCARLGSLLGSRVVEVVGAKMSAERWEGIRKEMVEIEADSQR